MPTPSTSSLDDLHARFDALVSPHLGQLLRFAQRRTQAMNEAEDLVQEACVRAWLALADLRDDAKARPWLYQILRGVISDMAEKHDRRRALVSITRLEDAHEEMVGSEPDFVFAEVAARLDGEILRRALSMIPDDFAAVVELHDIEGLKYHEIADVVGVPIGTVMSRMSRGRRLLAATIAANLNAWALGDDPRVPANPRAARHTRGR